MKVFSIGKIFKTFVAQGLLFATGTTYDNILGLLLRKRNKICYDRRYNNATTITILFIITQVVVYSEQFNTHPLLQ